MFLKIITLLKHFILFIFKPLTHILVYMLKQKNYFLIFILLLLPFGTILNLENFINHCSNNNEIDGVNLINNNEANLIDKKGTTLDTWEHWSIGERIYNSCATIIAIMLLMLLFNELFCEERWTIKILEYFFPEDPLEKEWVYPQDGKVRPPQNPKTRALEEYFVIPNKPYRIEGEINFPLLNRDIIEYSKIDFVYPPGRTIPPFMVKFLEICYGYDITQEVVMNLELHRKQTELFIGMEPIYNFVKWYYRHHPCQQLFTIGFSEEQLAYYEGKDFYSNRIFPNIYSRAYTLPMSKE